MPLKLCSLTHAEFIECYLRLFNVYYIFVKCKTWHLWVVAHVVALTCRHGTTENDLLLSQKRLLWSDIAADLCRDIVCQKLSNVVHLFVIACSVTAPHDVVRSIAISLSVCPLAYLKTTCSNDMQFSVYVACCRGLIFLWRHCNTLCTSAFVHDIMLSNNSDWNRKCSFLKNLTFSKTRLGHFLYIFSEYWWHRERICSEFSVDEWQCFASSKMS